MKILITGPQGSGKTTQAKVLAQKLGACFIGAGDLLRKFAEGDSKDAKMIKIAVGNGQLVDDLIIARLVKEKVAQEECIQGIVTDGYPRTWSQYKLYDPGFDQVFYLDVPDEEVEKRLLDRGRGDDTLKLIKERLGWYHKRTKPLLEYYSNLGKLTIINASQPLGMSDAQSIEKIAVEIEEKVKK